MKVLRLLLALLLLVTLTMSVTMATPQTPDADHPVTYQDDEQEDDESDDESDDDESDDDEVEDSDDDGVDDETEMEYEREVEVQEDDREWKIESELKNGDVKDEFKAEFKVGGGDEPEIKLEYSTEAGDSETEMKYRVNFDELIEFTDINGSGYQEDSDIVVSIYELDKADWNAIVYSSETLDGATVYTATATTTDGVFTLILKLSTGFADVNNTIVTPNAIKIDIVIDGFDYQGNETYLALQTDIKTEFETEIDEESEDEEKGYATNETQVSVTGDAASAFFSWVETADADGVVIDVISSGLVDVAEDDDDHDDDLEEGEDQMIMFFTFDAQNPDRIVWDPKVGIDNDAFIASAYAALSDAGIDPSSLPFPFWAIFAAFVIPVYVKRRK